MLVPETSYISPMTFALIGIVALTSFASYQHGKRGVEMVNEAQLQEVANVVESRWGDSIAKMMEGCVEKTKAGKEPLYFQFTGEEKKVVKRYSMQCKEEPLEIQK